MFCVFFMCITLYSESKAVTAPKDSGEIVARREGLRCYLYSILYKTGEQLYQNGGAQQIVWGDEGIKTPECPHPSAFPVAYLICGGSKGQSGLLHLATIQIRPRRRPALSTHVNC